MAEIDTTIDFKHYIEWRKAVWDALNVTAKDTPSTIADFLLINMLRRELGLEERTVPWSESLQLADKQATMSMFRAEVGEAIRDTGLNVIVDFSDPDILRRQLNEALQQARQRE